LANKDEIDIPKYEEYIQSTFEQVLDALELDFAEISGARKKLTGKSTLAWAHYFWVKSFPVSFCGP